jgi:hypothetical protein
MINTNKERRYPMSKKRANPYREGSKYANVFNDMRSAKQSGVSKQELKDAGHRSFDIDVVLSPKADSRGSISAQGHKYFCEAKRKDGVKRFVLRWRKEELEPKKRNVIVKVKQEKIASKTEETPEETVSTQEAAEVAV